MFNAIFGEVKGTFNIITIIEMIISLLFVFSGLIFYTNSQFSLTMVSLISGIFLILFGSSFIYSYMNRNDISLFNNNLFYGIVLILIGLLSLFIAKILILFIGISLIVCGLQKINYGYFLKKYNESSWLITLVMGFVCIIIGIISFFTDKNLMTQSVGISLLGFGSLNLIIIILLRRRSQYFIA